MTPSVDGVTTPRPALSLEQCRLMLARMSKSDAALFAALLLYGGEAREWSWGDAIFKWMEFPFELQHMLPAAEPRTYLWHARGRVTPYSTDEVTRRLRWYARLVGIEPGLVSLRLAVNTGKVLRARYGGAHRLARELHLDSAGSGGEMASAFSAVPWLSSKVSANGRLPRLRGLGRRSRRAAGS